VGEWSRENPAAFITSGLRWASGKVPALAGLVLIAPAAPAEAFYKDFILATFLTDPTAKRVKT